MRILLAEDDPVIADGICRALKRGGYAIDHVANGADADAALASQPYDLLILDLGLPKLPGIEVLKRLRGRKSAIPVLILTAQDGVEDRVRGLDAGADDYMTKPFALPELEARVRAHTRRGTGQPRCIEVGNLTYDQADHVVKINGQMVDLSAREVGLLEVFILRVGRLVSKDQLVDHLCGWGEEVSSNAIEVYVHRLRKKLEDSGVRIVTVRGLGYCLENPDAVPTAKI
ncbi:response regulator transcription factor [Azoarcus sp. L1K30]|uniref:response regulator transcription factor n=1 Tax=Azoarcus sp. L1K30 TaxID=2820277 RepID=UPI001B83CD04|nr:response regulator transcription factor [Azoarcus sp. L1K30]MBR0566600.1 response regulator transcription factor [Azoarcus sp. L1K30]